MEGERECVLVSGGGEGVCAGEWRGRGSVLVSGEGEGVCAGEWREGEGVYLRYTATCFYILT